MFKQYSCALCFGQKKIEIGRNLDNKSEKMIECPVCNGKGYVNVNFDFYNPDSMEWFKRLNGEL